MYPAVETRFELTKTLGATEMAVDHRHQLVPAAKAFAVFVGTVFRYQAIKRTSSCQLYL
jgi:hypothetical protein